MQKVLLKNFCDLPIDARFIVLEKTDRRGPLRTPCKVYMKVSENFARKLFPDVNAEMDFHMEPLAVVVEFKDQRGGLDIPG